MNTMDKMNKRAQLKESLEWITNIIFTMIVLTVMIWLISSFIDVNLNDTKPEIETIANRAIYSNALSFCDDLRCWPGIIDYNKVKNQTTLQEQFNKTMYSNFKSPLVAFKLDINDLQGNKITEGYFNQEWYLRWQPLTWSNKYKETSKRIYVILRNGTTTKQAILNLDLVMEVE